MNNCTILQTNIKHKPPKNHPQESGPYKSALLIDTDFVQELQTLQEIRDTLVSLPCSPHIQPIIDELSEILGLAHDGGGIDVERLWDLLCAARKGVATM